MNLVPIDDQLTNIAQMIRKCPKPTLRRAYGRAMREWCQQTQWLRTTIAGVTKAQTKVYSMGSDPNLDIMGIRAMSAVQGTTTFGLIPSDSSQWNLNLTPGFPRRYCYLPEGGFALDATPNAVYALTISIIIAPKETAIDIPVAPLVKWSNEIESGALAYLFGIPGQPWTNPAMVEPNLRDFQAGVANGKAEVQRSFNTGSQRSRPRPFGAGFMR